MFIVKEVTTIVRYCPNGHIILLPQDDHIIKFCRTCGTLLEEKQVVYDAPCCVNCNNPVDPCWDFCPYCGQKREGNHAYSRDIGHPANASVG